MRLTQGDLPPREGRGLLVGNFSFKSRSSPSNAQLASAGEIIPPCGVPFRSFVEDVLIQIPGLQPLSDNGSIHGDVSQKPIVRNPVETGLDVAFQNPLRVVFG